MSIKKPAKPMPKPAPKPMPKPSKPANGGYGIASGKTKSGKKC